MSDVYKQTTHSSIQIHLFVNLGARLRSQTRSTTLSYSTRASQAQKNIKKIQKTKTRTIDFLEDAAMTQAQRQAGTRRQA